MQAVPQAALRVARGRRAAQPVQQQRLADRVRTARIPRHASAPGRSQSQSLRWRPRDSAPWMRSSGRRDKCETCSRAASSQPATPTQCAGNDLHLAGLHHGWQSQIDQTPEFARHRWHCIGHSWVHTAIHFHVRDTVRAALHGHYVVQYAAQWTMILERAGRNRVITCPKAPDHHHVHTTLIIVLQRQKGTTFCVGPNYTSSDSHSKVRSRCVRAKG